MNLETGDLNPDFVRISVEPAAGELMDHVHFPLISRRKLSLLGIQCLSKGKLPIILFVMKAKLKPDSVSVFLFIPPQSANSTMSFTGTKHFHFLEHFSDSEVLKKFKML